jgi:hypothetical protein
MKTALALATFHLALAQAFLLAIPARAGWNALPSPRIPATTTFRDWRGMETSRFLAGDSGELYLYVGDTLYRGRERGAEWEAIIDCPYADRERIYTPLLITRGDWLICNGKFTTNRGADWAENPPQLYGMIWLTLVPGNRFLGSRYYGTSLFLSADTGANFEAVGGMRDWYQQFAEAGDFRYLVAGRTADMLYSPDGGHTWNPLVEAVGDSVAAVRAFALAADPHRAEGTAYALSDPEGPTRLSVIRWQESSIRVKTRPAGPGFPDSAVTCFRAAPMGAGTRLWVGTWGQGLFSSDDAGVSWRQSNEGLGDLHVGGLAVSGEDVFVMTREGLYRETSPTGVRRVAARGIRGTAQQEGGPTLQFRRPYQNAWSQALFRIDGKQAPKVTQAPVVTGK